MALFAGDGANAALALAVTRTGSHCPFFEGLLGATSWAEATAVEFFAAALRADAAAKHDGGSAQQQRVQAVPVGGARVMHRGAPTQRRRRGGPSFPARQQRRGRRVKSRS